jgi:hypothetical protein
MGTPMVPVGTVARREEDHNAGLLYLVGAATLIGAVLLAVVGTPRLLRSRSSRHEGPMVYLGLGRWVDDPNAPCHDDAPYSPGHLARRESELRDRIRVNPGPQHGMHLCVSMRRQVYCGTGQSARLRAV